MILVKLSKPLYELVNLYGDVFKKPGKLVAWDIKYKIELLDPEKTIPHHTMQRISERKLQKVQNNLKDYL